MEATVPCHPTVESVRFVWWRQLYLVTQLWRVCHLYGGRDCTLSPNCREWAGCTVEHIVSYSVGAFPCHPNMEHVLFVRWRQLYLITQLLRVCWSYGGGNCYYSVTQLWRVSWLYGGGNCTLSPNCGEYAGRTVEATVPCHPDSPDCQM